MTSYDALCRCATFLGADMTGDGDGIAGTTCLLGGSPSCGSDCSGAPMLPLLYIALNLGFNIAALNLLKTAGIVPSSVSAATARQNHACLTQISRNDQSKRVSDLV